MVHDLEPAARALAGVAAQVRDDDLDRPTPCGDWTVRHLLGHALELSAGFVATARKEPTPGEPATGLPDDWQDLLAARLAALVRAWQDPQAWEGESEAGGVTMPAEALGVVALDELVLHGWDLSRAVGAPFVVGEDDVVACLGFVETFEHVDDEGRAGLFGRIVARDADADATGEAPLDRLLRLSGRTPGWRSRAAV